MREKRDIKLFLASGIGSAVLFFILTNFGAWLTMYPPTLEGLKACYIAAIPFFRMNLVSTIVYCGLFYGIYELTARWVKGTKWAEAIL